MTTDPLAWVRAEMDAAEKEAEAARDFDYAQCGAWEARGPYPAECGEADGVSRPRGNLRAEIGTDDIFLEAELPWDLIPHMARHDPAAVLRRIKAERKVLDEHPQHGIDPECARCVTWDEDDEGDLVATPKAYPCTTVRLIAEGWGWGWTEETT